MASKRASRARSVEPQVMSTPVRGRRPRDELSPLDRNDDGAPCGAKPPQRLRIDIQTASSITDSSTTTAIVNELIMLRKQTAEAFQSTIDEINANRFAIHDLKNSLNMAKHNLDEAETDIHQQGVDIAEHSDKSSR